MKKSNKLIFLVLMISSLNANSQIDSTNISPMLEEYYKKGLKIGAEKAYKEGYIKGLMYADKKIRLWATKMKGNESGKYLKEYAGKIGSPNLYQTKHSSGEGVSVVVKGCVIEKQLTPDEIIDLTPYPIDAIGNEKIDYINAPNASKEVGHDISNSVADLSNVSSFEESRPNNPYSSKKSYLYLPKNKSIANKLNDLNYAYAVENNSIKVVFNSEREKNILANKLNNMR